MAGRQAFPFGVSANFQRQLILNFQGQTSGKTIIIPRYSLLLNLFDIFWILQLCFKSLKLNDLKLQFSFTFPERITDPERSWAPQIQAKQGAGWSSNPHEISNIFNMVPKIGVPPKSSISNRVFHYKPSILGAHPYFWVDTHIIVTASEVFRIFLGGALLVHSNFLQNVFLPAPGQ